MCKIRWNVEFIKHALVTTPTKLRAPSRHWGQILQPNHLFAEDPAEFTTEEVPSVPLVSLSFIKCMDSFGAHKSMKTLLGGRKSIRAVLSTVSYC